MPLSVRFVLMALVVVSLTGPDVTATQRSGQEQPDVTGDTDGRHAWMTAVYRDLIVRKLCNRARRSVSIDMRHELDAVTISIDDASLISVSRKAQRVVINSPQSRIEARGVLRESDAVSQLLALERESVRLRSAPELALLATIAFVGSLAGDEDAPGRLLERPIGDPRWFQPVPPDRCAPAYVVKNQDAWDRARACASEGDGPPACRATWFQQAEAAWFDYLNCVSPVVRP